jgi:hypothetical protein
MRRIRHFLLMDAAFSLKYCENNTFPLDETSDLCYLMHEK